MNYRKKFVIEPGEKVHLDKIDPSYTGKHESHEQAMPKIQENITRMDKLQYLFMPMAISHCWLYCRHWMPPAKMG
jgi:hypothetical protein